MNKTHILVLLLAVSVLVNLAVIASFVASEGQVQDLIARTNTLSARNLELQQQLSAANLGLQGSTCSLEYYRTRFARPLPNGTSPAIPFEGTATMIAPSVSQTVGTVRNGPIIQEVLVMNGTLMNISVTAQPGQGRVLVQTTPLMGIVFQDAANTAVAVAQNRTRLDLSGTDILFSIQTDKEVPAVDGPSAGALMALLTIAALGHRTIDPTLTLTGTIDQNGHVGAIGGAVEKAAAAKRFGLKQFLLPQDNTELTIYNQHLVNYRGFQLVDYVPDTVEAKTYIQQNTGINVTYVSSIDDVTAIALE